MDKWAKALAPRPADPQGPKSLEYHSPRFTSQHGCYGLGRDEASSILSCTHTPLNTTVPEVGTSCCCSNRVRAMVSTSQAYSRDS